MNFVQYSEGGKPALAVVEGNRLHKLADYTRLYDLAWDASKSSSSLEDLATTKLSGQYSDYEAVIAEGRLLPPIDHPNPANLLVSGTGLSHLGSATTRDEMHSKLSDEASLSDSMKMFKWGVEGGKPAEGNLGVQPEWFYKGDGSWVAPPEGDLISPDFALDGGEEPELVGIYLIGNDNQVYRLGFALGNEFSDHVTEKQNYLYLAHSKLRACSFGPELRTGDLAADVRGTSRIVRQGKTIWSKPFLSGEDNMCHSIRNLEQHHFKYPQFRRPGDVHVHFFGTATLSFADGVRVQEGDQFVVEAEGFGKPLRNRMKIGQAEAVTVTAL